HATPRAYKRREPPAHAGVQGRTAMQTTNEDRGLVGQDLQGHEDSSRSDADKGISRRSFIQAGALAGGSAALGTLSVATAQDNGNNDNTNLDHINRDIGIAGATLAQLQEWLSNGQLSSRELVDIYLRRIAVIDKGLDLRAFIEINPDVR